MLGKREYGDYQTPLEFAKRVCLYLKEVRALTPSAIVEPTCGEGHFLQSSVWGFDPRHKIISMLLSS